MERVNGGSACGHSENSISDTVLSIGDAAMGTHMCNTCSFLCVCLVKTWGTEVSGAWCPCLALGQRTHISGANTGLGPQRNKTHSDHPSPASTGMEDGVETVLEH